MRVRRNEGGVRVRREGVATTVDSDPQCVTY